MWQSHVEMKDYFITYFDNIKRSIAELLLSVYEPHP